MALEPIARRALSAADLGVGHLLGDFTAQLRRVGVPYTDEEIAAAGESVRGKTEIEALIAYLQVLGTSVK